MKLEHFLIPYTRINSKWIKDLNVRPENTKLLEENISRTLDNINQSKILYEPPPRVMEIKTKVVIQRNREIKIFLSLSFGHKVGKFFIYCIALHIYAYFNINF